MSRLERCNWHVPWARACARDQSPFPCSPIRTVTALAYGRGHEEEPAVAIKDLRLLDSLGAGICHGTPTVPTTRQARDPQQQFLGIAAHVGPTSTLTRCAALGVTREELAARDDYRARQAAGAYLVMGASALHYAAEFQVGRAPIHVGHGDWVRTPDEVVGFCDAPWFDSGLGALFVRLNVFSATLRQRIRAEQDAGRTVGLSLQTRNYYDDGHRVVLFEQLQAVDVTVGEHGALPGARILGQWEDRESILAGMCESSDHWSHRSPGL